MRTSQKIIFAAAALLSIVSFGIIRQGMSEDAQPNKLVAVNAVNGDSAHTARLTSSSEGSLSTANEKKQKPSQAATCENPIVKTRKAVPIEERNAFLVEAMKNVPATATPEEVAAFIEQVGQNAPVEKVSITVFVDDPEAAGPAPEAEDDPDGAKFDAWAEKVRQLGCKNRDNRGGVQLISFSTTLWDNSTGWKSCTKSDSFQNKLGATLAKLRQTSYWYNNAYDLPQYPDKTVSSTTYYGWSKDGSLQGWKGKVVAWLYGTPMTLQNYSYQHYVLKISAFGITWVADDGDLGVSQDFGPGGRCV